MRHFQLILLLSIVLSWAGQAQNALPKSVNTNAQYQEDSLGIRNMISIDLANFIDNNPAFLLSYEHRLGRDFRLAHTAGPILAIDTYDPYSKYSELGFKVWGFKLREEVMILNKQVKPGVMSYIGFGLTYSKIRIGGVPYIEEIIDGSSIYFKRHTSALVRNKIGYYLLLGRTYVKRSPTVISWNIGLGLQNRTENLPGIPDDIQGRISDDDESTFIMNGRFLTAVASLKIGFMPNKKSKFRKNKEQYQHLSSEERKKQLATDKAKRKEEKKLRKQKRKEQKGLPKAL